MVPAIWPKPRSVGVEENVSDIVSAPDGKAMGARKRQLNGCVQPRGRALGLGRRSVPAGVPGQARCRGAVRVLCVVDDASIDAGTGAEQIVPSTVSGRTDLLRAFRAFGVDENSRKP